MNQFTTSLTRLATFALLGMLLLSTAVAQTHRVYFGTYTDNNSRGIYTCTFDDNTGKLSPVELAGECKNPSFVAIHPNGKYLYAVSEVGDFQGNRTGGIQAFRIGDRGGLEPLNAVESSGQGPCHLTVDADGRHVLVANYNSGSVSVVRLAEDGTLGNRTAFVQHMGSGADPARQDGPHAHCIHLDSNNRFVFACDLGLDQIRIYRFDRARGELESADPPYASSPAGGGPRHFSWHPSGKFAFANNELSSSVTGYAYDGGGHLRPINTVSTLPSDFDGKNNTTAEVQVHPSGRFLYCSNRGHDSLALMSIDSDSGKLAFVEAKSSGGKTPRNFAISPSGKFVISANQSTNNVVVFTITEETGRLVPSDQSLNVPTPVCIKFLPLGR